MLYNKKEETIMNENKQIIETTISNTHFVLSKVKNTNSLSILFKNLFLSYLILSLLYFIYYIGSKQYGFWPSEEYFTIYRLTIIPLYIVTPILYFLFIRKIELSLSEKSFLYTYSAIPILISFNMIMFPILYYFNSDILYYMHTMIPLDVIAACLGFALLSNYVKDRKLLIPIILLIIYLIVVVLTKVTLENSIEITSFTSVLIKINNITTYISQYNFVAVLSFFISWLYLRKSRNEN